MLNFRELSVFWMFNSIHASLPGRERLRGAAAAPRGSSVEEGYSAIRLVTFTVFKSHPFGHTSSVKKKMLTPPQEIMSPRFPSAPKVSRAPCRCPGPPTGQIPALGHATSPSGTQVPKPSGGEKSYKRTSRCSRFFVRNTCFLLLTPTEIPESGVI